MRNNGIIVNHYNTVENKLFLPQLEHQAKSWTLLLVLGASKGTTPLSVSVIPLPGQATFTGLRTTWLAGRQAANRKYGMGK